MRTHKIPVSGEPLPVIGLGTSRTFTELNSQEVRDRLGKVVDQFFGQGGTLIDTSPMYGPAETTLGVLLKGRDKGFLATKVWTRGEQAGKRQMAESAQKMGVKVIDLMQIHNLLDWKTHLPTLRKMKEEGTIRYIGITTWGGNDHDQFVKVMKEHRPDFIQFTYSPVSREAESRILPLAQDLGIATLINRPFERGSLFGQVKGQPVPAWAREELGVKSWAQVMIKFVLSHPASTCVIPATSKPHHLEDNMGAGFGPLPDKTQRERLAQLFQ